MTSTVNLLEITLKVSISMPLTIFSLDISGLLVLLAAGGQPLDCALHGAECFHLVRYSAQGPGFAHSSVLQKIWAIFRVRNKLFAGECLGRDCASIAPSFVEHHNVCQQHSGIVLHICCISFYFLVSW